jgi:signal transduction histidine kinase
VVEQVQRVRPGVVAVLCLLAASLLLAVLEMTGGSPTGSFWDKASILALVAPSVSLGLLVIRRRPGNPSGPAMALLGVAVLITDVIERWGQTYGTGDQWPAAGLAAAVKPGVWVFNLAGFFLLCLVFPHGRLPGRLWRALPWLGAGAAIAANAMISLAPDQYQHDGGALPGATPLHVPGPVRVVLIAAAYLWLLTALILAVWSLVLRYRRGDPVTRMQLRWMLLGAASVPALLAAGWVAEAAGAPTAVAYAGFMLALLVVLPLALAVAILRHDLFDVDRVLSETAAWLLTTLVAAGLFALVVFGAAQLSLRDSRVSAVGAAFIVALVLLPAHRWLHHGVARVFDRERTVVLARMRDFVRQVRDGQAEPEEVQEVLRRGADDPGLLVLLRLPGSPTLVGLDGIVHDKPLPAGSVPLVSGGSDVGVVLLTRPAARRLRRMAHLLVEARMPIEVSRLRLQLRSALDDARSSRERLVHATATERRRLERDLHDGAQQRIVAVGMRLRSIQRTHEVTEATRAELDTAVGELESIVGELRRLAHGVRPAQLDDGLETAVRSLAAGSPIPVTLEIEPDLAISEAVATTAYYVIAEGLANTLKHARATRAKASFTRTASGHVIELQDDGVGGVTAGLTALHDRIAALGGRLEVISPPGCGTTLRVEL